MGEINLGVFLFIAITYFLPSIIAEFRKHVSFKAILALNLLAGWTFIGWVVAIVWALTDAPQIATNKPLPQSTADEIQKLATLKEQGLLTEAEFNMQKQLLLKSSS